MSRSERLLAMFTVLLLFAVADLASAQVTRREANRLAVDVLTLKAGGELRGVILDRNREAVQMAVRREWLAKHQPDLLARLPAASSDEAQLRQLAKRIEQWLSELKTVTDPADRSKPNNKNAAPNRERNTELLRVLQAERETYQEYLDDPLKLPPGEGTPAARREAYRELANRLETWIAELQGKPAPGMAVTAKEDQLRKNRAELIRILKSEHKELAQRLNQPEAAGDEASAFVSVGLSRAEVGLVFAQTPARQRLAVAAFLQNLPNVEETAVSDLQQQLKAAGVDGKSASSDPSQLITDAQPQSDWEWAARRAIYEYQFLRRLDFQGTGNFITQTGPEAPPPNLAEVLQGTLDQQMSLALGDLLDEPIFTGLDFGGLGGAKNKAGWQAKAIRIAEQQGVRGFRVTRMTPDLQRRQTVVEDRFLARMPDGSWETVWQATETKSARNANQNDLDRIKQDPQLKQALGLVEGLGLGAGGNLDLALQFGAATMNAQQATDDEFYEFRDRYSQRLDGPPLSWK